MNVYASSAASPGTFPNLKRTRPGANGLCVSSITAAPLPKIHSGDLVLKVFTHKSLRRATHSSANPDDYDDNERLADLGKAALDVAVTHILFNKRPMLKPPDMSLQRKRILSDENINNWVTFYNLRMKLRCHPNLYVKLNTPQETRSIFYAYVGGVYAESGQEAVREWIELLAQGIATESESPESVPPFREETPPQKKMKSEPLSPSTESSIFFASQPPPSAFRHPPPHMELPRSLPAQNSQFQSLPPSSHFQTLQQVQAPPNPLAPAQPNLPFLPLFNQTASQRRVTVEYPAEFSGPSHAGQWTVQCVVNGIRKGVGTGGSKQVAKEEAARQAYYAMGWT